MTRASFLAWLGLAPQTRTGVESMNAPSDGVYASIGGLTGMATIEAPLSLVLEGGRLILRSTATVPTTSTRIRGEVPSASTTNPLQYALARAAKTGTLAVWRNGLRQSVGVDYSITGPNIFTFVTAYASSPRVPLVVCDYDPA